MDVSTSEPHPAVTARPLSFLTWPGWSSMNHTCQQIAPGFDLERNGPVAVDIEPQSSSSPLHSLEHLQSRPKHQIGSSLRQGQGHDEDPNAATWRRPVGSSLACGQTTLHSLSATIGWQGPIAPFPKDSMALCAGSFTDSKSVKLHLGELAI